MTSGLDDVVSLVDALRKHQWRDFATSLQEYSDVRVPENNAATELNYVLFIQSNPLFWAMEKIRSLIGVPPFSATVHNPDVKLTSTYKRCDRHQY